MGTFGEWLRQQRQARRLTRQELAGRVGCSVAMLRKIEGDERRPSVQIAGLLANAFDLPAADRSVFIRVARGELGTSRLPRGAGPADQPDASQDPLLPADNLPVYPTPLIGRRRELVDLSLLIHDPHCRLLTLVGPGGTGKTRLAVELASGLRDDFAEGACFVGLASAGSMRLVVPMMAGALGFAFQSAESGEPRAQLFNHLQDKHMLLLLDNVEQLLQEPGIELLAELLDAAPGVKLLVTSREPLNLQAEWVFQVAGLPVPADPHGEQRPEGTSAELFLQRARRAWASFAATTDDYPAIVRICQLAEGMPLAIELAAGWVRTLTCGEIAAELEKSLDFLSVSARDLPARHRSMRAVFDHSWTLLTPPEQRALARLSVFRGGFAREAAEQVAGASLQMLSSLGAKSLARRSGEGRYDLHELIRQYAALHLQADPAEEADARQQHYAFYLDLAEASDLHLKTSAQLQWLRRLEEEHDNLRAALAWSFNALGEPPGDFGEAALRLGGALRLFWRMGSYYREGCAYLKKSLGMYPGEANGTAPASPAASPNTDRPAYWSARARALQGLALLENALGHHTVAHELAEESAAIFRRLDDRQGLGESLLIIGLALHWQGDADLGHTRTEQALELFRQLGDRWSVARALFHLGTYLADFAGDDSGIRMLEESEAILDEIGDRFILASLLVTRGIKAFTRGDYAEAGAYFSRALALAQELRDPWGMADALTNSGCVLRTQGSYDAARSQFLEAQRVYEQWGRGPWCADALCALAENEMAQGHLAPAASYLEQAASYVHAPENKWLHVLVTYFEGLLAFHRGELHTAADLLEQTVALARASHFKPDLARSLVALARTLGETGEAERARVFNSEALALFSASGCKLGIAMALETFAGLATVERAERAARLVGTAEAIRSTIGAPLPPVDCAHHDRMLAALRDALGERHFGEAQQQGRTEALGTVVEEILAAFKAGGHLAPAVRPGAAPSRPATTLGSA